MPEPASMLDLLAAEAVAARRHAYAPYSKFEVGAAVLGESGRIYTGCNVENVSFGATICAERAAVCRAVGEGERRITAIAVAGPLPGAVVRPCGVCRQFLVEFAGPDIPVVCQNATGSLRDVTTLGALLPLAFDRLT